MAADPFDGMNEVTWTEGNTLPLTNPGPGATVKGKPVVADGFNAVFLGSGTPAGERAPADVETTRRIPVQNATNVALPAGTLLRWTADKTSYGPAGQAANGQAAAWSGKVLGRTVQAIPASTTSRVWVKFLQLAD